MSREKVINGIRNTHLPVIICGAGIVGKTLLSICEKEGIEVECFCDSSTKLSGTEFCGLEVLYTNDLKSRYKDAAFLISVAAIKDVVDRLHDLGYSYSYAGGPLLKEIDIAQCQENATIDYTKYAIENCILCHDGYLNPNKLFLRSVDLIITERCSLRCKDCSNLMQYYEKPKDCNLDMLLKAIGAFCSLIDEVMDFRVIGGDAFMNKEWPIIVQRLSNEPKAKRVVLYTNGTIVPKQKDISCLINHKVVVIVTDYGPLSIKLNELKQLLKENRIIHHVLKITEWLACSDIGLHSRSITEKVELFKNCCAKNMATLSDGKLFRCPYSANANRLCAVPNFKQDYVNLFQEPLDDIGIIKTKNKIRNYLLNIKYLETCDYCNGRPLAGVDVQPAVQAARPLKHKKYIYE